MLSKLGFLLFIIGAAGMDSPDRTVPAIMVLSGIAIIAVSAAMESPEENMEYRIEYCNGRCQNYADSRKDLLEWLSILKDEVITDIQKIWKDGKTESVMDKYRKYMERKR